MNNWFYICFFGGIVLIVTSIMWQVAEMLIDHECYQLEPNEFYKSSICENYWRDR